MAEVSI